MVKTTFMERQDLKMEIEEGYNQMSEAFRVAEESLSQIKGSNFEDFAIFMKIIKLKVKVDL